MRPGPPWIDCRKVGCVIHSSGTRRLLTWRWCELQAALKQSQPSSKREGFATVPNVTWDHIGALQSVHRELQKSIIVRMIVWLITITQCTLWSTDIRFIAHNIFSPSLVYLCYSSYCFCDAEIYTQCPAKNGLQTNCYNSAKTWTSCMKF